MHIHAFSPMEIVYGVELTGMKLSDYLSMLRDNGLDTLPGTAAEILDDEIRHILSANKLSTAQWIEVIRTAHRTGNSLHFHDDVWSYRNVRALGSPMYLLRKIQDETGASPNLSARLRAPEHVAIPSRPVSHRAHACGTSENSRAGAPAACRLDQ